MTLHEAMPVAEGIVYRARQKGAGSLISAQSRAIVEREIAEMMVFVVDEQIKRSKRKRARAA